MDKLQNFAFMLVICFYLYTSTKQSMHMFQQNRYQLQRYITWLQDEVHVKYKQIGKLCLCLLGMYGLFFISQGDVGPVVILLLIIYSYVLYKVEDMKVYRKPLVFTKRIQRLCCAFYAVYILLLSIAFHTITMRVWLLILPFLYFLPWILLVPIAILMRPIEDRIRMHFVHEAKDILRSHQQLQIIGITGSYGKTSIKTMLHDVLADTFYTLMTPNSYNNQMGITLTIRHHLQSLHEVFLCEMGADHVHEIERLMDFVQPSIGIVSAVGPQHLQTFHTIGNILHEKMQMIEKLPMDGIGFINIDNEHIRHYKIKNSCTIITYGIHQDALYRSMNIQYHKEGTTFTLTHNKQTHPFTTRLLGEHNVLNITCVIAVAHTLGIEWNILQRIIAGLPYVEHRLQIRETSSYTILDNAYNSNPEGARYALEVIQQMEGTHIIVTPGFLDLGEESVRAHIQFGEQIAQYADIAILVGEHQSKDIVKGIRAKNFPLSKLHVVKHIDEAFSLLEEIADQNTTVLFENDLPDAFNH